MTEDRPNPKAKIGFVIYYPFQFYVYKNVYAELADTAEFIIDFGPYYPFRTMERILPPIRALLDKHGAKYRILDESLYSSPSSMDQFLSKYDALVSVWLRGCISSTAAAKKQRINMTYGVGKELATFSLKKVDFDLILAYGKKDHAFYSLLTKSIIVGNPKFDEWFRESVDMQAASSIESRLDNKKKTLLYLPTHSDLSSIRQLADELKQLSDTYTIIVKLHYYTPTDEPALVEKLKHPGIIILEDDFDILPLLKLADLVISDNSSAIFDVILTDKPIIATNFHDPNYFATVHQQAHRYSRGFAPPLTYPNSIEQKIKKDGTIDTIQDPKDLRKTIARVLQSDEKKEKRRILRDELFSYNDGHSGKHAADAIQRHMVEPKPERPFLYYALNTYAAVIWQRAIYMQGQKSRYRWLKYIGTKIKDFIS